MEAEVGELSLEAGDVGYAKFDLGFDRSQGALLDSFLLKVSIAVTSGRGCPSVLLAVG